MHLSLVEQMTSFRLGLTGPGMQLADWSVAHVAFCKILPLTSADPSSYASHAWQVSDHLDQIVAAWWA